jgi:hypothetical protein
MRILYILYFISLLFSPYLFLSGYIVYIWRFILQDTNTVYGSKVLFDNILNYFIDFQVYLSWVMQMKVGSRWRDPKDI